jgi:hypothetical protein
VVEGLLGAELRVGNTSITASSNFASMGNNRLVWSQPANGLYIYNTSTTIHLSTPAVGRWVTLRSRGGQLTVAELQVYNIGKPAA